MTDTSQPKLHNHDWPNWALIKEATLLVKP